MGNISDKENIYSFWGHCQRSKVTGNFLVFFFSIPFSNATMCCDNWNTFLQRTFKLGQNVCLGKILIKFEYGSSGVSLYVRLSVQPHFLSAAITGNTFLQRTFKLRQNVCLGKILVKFKYGSSAVFSVHPSICLSVCKSTLSLSCDNWNTFL